MAKASRFGANLRRWIIPAALFGVCLLGCAPSEESVEEVIAPKIAFDGKIEPDYSGKWSTKDKNSSMDLESTGKCTLVNSAPGRGTTTQTGEWRVNGENLLFKLEMDGNPVTRYVVSLAADKKELRLEQRASKLRVIYRRQSGK